VGGDAMAMAMEMSKLLATMNAAPRAASQHYNYHSQHPPHGPPLPSIKHRQW